MAGTVDSSNPKNIELEILTIVNNEGDGFDIRDVMLECNIYESISRNFLLGECIISDSVALLENAKLFGQESIRIRFKQATGSGDEPHIDDTIDQVFRIYKIDSVTRIDSANQVFKINFCSTEMLASKRIRISQAFRGSLTDIAAQIAEDHLKIVNKNLDTKCTPYFQVREKSDKDNYHVVIPNWSAGYAINWLCKRAQGIGPNSGLQDSFFWYQTANGSYRISSLASMMKVNYAGGRPFSYASVNAADGKDEPYDITLEKTQGHSGNIGMGRRILSYEVRSHADVLKGVINGLFASKQTTIDNTYKIFTEKTYSFLDKHFSRRSSIEAHPFVRTQPEILWIGGPAGEIEVGASSCSPGDITAYRDSSRPGKGKTISDYPDAHQILTSDSAYVNDATNKIWQSNHRTHLGQIQFRAAAKELLEYYTISLVLSARTDISVGTLINLDIPAVRPGGEVEEPKFNNGRHLITELAWNINAKHECTLSVKCIKDSVINNIETTVMEYGESSNV